MSWRCPYCDQIATLLDSNTSSDTHTFNLGNKDGNLALGTKVIVCPNSTCKQYTISASLQSYESRASGRVLTGKPHNTWKLRPASTAKPLPEYIPRAIQDDYYEACLIADLSPKASATLSRRCLQGMIRNFFGVSDKTLWAEIQAIKDKVDPTTWEAIDAVRSIGNIGAHMEADIDLIVDVDPGEAALLIGLIETLIDEWYVHRHQRAQRMSKIVAVAAEKKADRESGKTSEETAMPETGGTR